MSIGDNIFNLRNSHKFSQATFADIIGISQQTVQKWESGDTVPSIDKLILIAQKFNISLDSLVFNSDEKTSKQKSKLQIEPNYSILHCWELYSENLNTEYNQAIEEGDDISEYKELFTAVSKLPISSEKEKLADILFSIVLNSKRQDGYKYDEPSTLDGIKAIRKPYPIIMKQPSGEALEKKITGAWYGRICGCLLGKSVEGSVSEDLKKFLTMTNNYPMKRYILSSDFTRDDVKDLEYCYADRPYVDQYHMMPADDDTNYTVLYQELIERCGKNFVSNDVLDMWVGMQPKNAYCTAERVAFCNYIKGYEAPLSAKYKNPYREWIGAQIRADYFGYINIGNPALAAEMAYRDACISHIKNGIYGEMFVAAMIASAGCLTNILDIIYSGLAQIPYTSRLYEKIISVIEGYKNGVTEEQFFAKLHKDYNERISHCWCHTITNAMIVVASLLYGNGDYSKSICMAVQTGFDTDCNGATVGSILGMRNGIDGIGKEWTSPLNDTLDTAIFGVNKVKISDRIKKTLSHIQMN